MRYHLIYQPVLFSLRCAHYTVALDVSFDHFNRLTRVSRKYFARQSTHSHDLFRMYLYIRCLAGYPAYRWLMY
jgi:hypothetical protein